jgi:hypothetical protein
MGEPGIADHSLRDQFERGGEAAGDALLMLEHYHPLLMQVFPIDGEIETLAAYHEYLSDRTMEWDIVVLSDPRDGRILGGIHWQPLRGLDTAWADTLAWVEHVWLLDDPDVRRYSAFHHLLATVRRHMRRRGAHAGFMEFNDPEKMTAAEIEQDAAGGLSTRDRLVLWAGVGLSELVYVAADGRRLPAPYAQPAMDGGPPMRILSLGFFSLVQDLARSELSTADYLRILHRAHSTIRGVDPAIDPTCVAYTAAVRVLGVTGFAFSPLKHRLAGSPPGSRRKR